MGDVRSLIRNHYGVAMLVMAAALLLRVLVPQGYMLAPSPGSTTLTVQLCNGESGHQTMEIVLPGSGKTGADTPGHDGKSDTPCPYAALSMALHAAADALLLAGALAFILALGFSATRQTAPARLVHFRPPLRGPPALV